MVYCREKFRLLISSSIVDKYQSIHICAAEPQVRLLVIISLLWYFLKF